MEVVIIMGSKSDLPVANKVVSFLKKFNLTPILRVASAHKAPAKVLQILKEYDSCDPIFITIAGRSNALSGFVDANTPHPVIACPPYSEKFAGVDIFSTLRMPSGVAPLTVLEPEQAGLAVVKILSRKDKKLKQKLIKYQQEKKKEIEEADEEVRNG